jgi:phosphohistidine phosphatase SixA
MSAGAGGPPPAAVSRVLLLRHAEAGERSEWRGVDRERPLTPAGRSQSDQLASAFDGQPLQRLLTSGYARCRETVAPIAARLGLTVEAVPWLEEGAAPGGALAALVAAGNVLACTHGDVVSGILLELADHSIDIGSTPRMQKGSTWILDVEDGRVVTARYVPPPG